MKYGFTDGEWRSGIKEATAILRRRAGERRTITYSDLASEMHSISIGYHDPAMDLLLSEVSREEHESGRGLLSVVVVHKYGDLEPGKGFYDLAKHLGFNFSDRAAFWIAELNRVWDFWSSRDPLPTDLSG